MLALYSLSEKNCLYIEPLLLLRSFSRMLVLSFSHSLSYSSFSFVWSKASKALIQIMISRDLIRSSRALSLLMIRSLLSPRALSPSQGDSVTVYSYIHEKVVKTLLFIYGHGPLYISKISIVPVIVILVMHTIDVMTYTMSTLWWS